MSEKETNTKPERGLESLRKAVMSDCKDGENCFSENGCTKVRYNYMPEDNPRLIAMGIKTKCLAATKCTHDYCGKYKWILERAQHYAEKSNKTTDEIIKSWEEDRSYWYMNYYQDCNQPLIEADNVILFEQWEKKGILLYGEDKKK